MLHCYRELSLLVSSLVCPFDFLITEPRLISKQISAADGHDEIDVEILGSDKDHFQSNVYAPSPTDKQPLWGVFGKMEDVQGSDISAPHNYTIDWTSERIQWSVDGTVVRTLKPC